jgi:hypothetical protein
MAVPHVADNNGGFVGVSCYQFLDDIERSITAFEAFLHRHGEIFRGDFKGEVRQGGEGHNQSLRGEPGQLKICFHT